MLLPTRDIAFLLTIREIQVYPTTKQNIIKASGYAGETPFSNLQNPRRSVWIDMKHNPVSKPAPLLYKRCKVRIISTRYTTPITNTIVTATLGMYSVAGPIESWGMVGELTPSTFMRQVMIKSNDANQIPALCRQDVGSTSSSMSATKITYQAVHIAGNARSTDPFQYTDCPVSMSFIIYIFVSWLACR